MSTEVHTQYSLRLTLALPKLLISLWENDCGYGGLVLEQGVAPKAVGYSMWYMHDGATAHFSVGVRNVPSNTSHYRWIGTAESRAHQISSFGFLLPGTPRNPCVCNNEETLHRRTMNACQNIRSWTDVAVYDETCRGTHWISLRTFWQLIIDEPFQL